MTPLSLVEAMPWRGGCAPEGAIVGIIGEFGKFRGIGEGRALPARLICKPGGLLILLAGYVYVPGTGAPSTPPPQRRRC